MTKKFHLILLMVTIGFFLIPTLTYSCEMKSKKACCNKEMAASNKEKMDCCNKSNNSKGNDKDHNGCNGKCGHSNCTTSTVQFSLALFEIKFKNNNFEFSQKEQNYFNTDTNISAGFFSIWLIPKIS